MDPLEVVMKEASPGNLVSEAKWHKWEPAFENYLSSAFGEDSVPLSYIIPANNVPDHDGDYPYFIDKCVAQAPLVGPAFDTNKCQVHQMMVTFMSGELS